ncbi:DUF2199 domain-containing protein [Oleomonas cavernae]|uniref:DUF2199 domain-containing protein n=1 Tax=Oleomonas cavernae TaxID=2320859 RepID=A0A418VTX9_9PROT|nr:DUF2199 domain-containing protein [Oleomonas cavernae]RJF80602.1 DUF2199 domain-containing protein [Oleomonas cavernae]
MSFEFQCHRCGQVHKGMPRLGPDVPDSYHEVSAAEQAARCTLSADDCVIDRTWFFVRGALEIPVAFEDEAFAWLVWVSLNESDYKAWRAARDLPRRAPPGPFRGWLNTRLPGYPDTLNLETRLHLRDRGRRPLVEVAPTGHPLALEQQDGIAAGRVVQLYTLTVHGAP